jgi:hypothetical protein
MPQAAFWISTEAPFKQGFGRAASFVEKEKKLKQQSSRKGAKTPRKAKDSSK